MGEREREREEDVERWNEQLVAVAAVSGCFLVKNVFTWCNCSFRSLGVWNFIKLVLPLRMVALGYFLDRFSLTPKAHKHFWPIFSKRDTWHFLSRLSHWYSTYFFSLFFCQRQNESKSSPHTNDSEQRLNLSLERERRDLKMWTCKFGWRQSQFSHSVTFCTTKLTFGPSETVAVSVWVDGWAGVRRKRGIKIRLTSVYCTVNDLWLLNPMVNLFGVYNGNKKCYSLSS